MKKPTAFFLFGISLFSCGIISSPPPAGFAVVYGIAAYNLLPDLSFTDDDAFGVAAMLEGKGYDVILRSTDGTKDQLSADINNVAGRIGLYDNFIFYFAGHGGRHYDRYLRYSDTPGTEPAYQDGDDEWIFLSGSLTADSFESWPDTAVKDDELREMLEIIPSKKKLVIIDACNSGGFLNDNFIIDAIPPDYGASVRLDAILQNSISLYAAPDSSSLDIPGDMAIVMAAAGEREYSLENAGIDHGIFTYFLLQTPEYADNNGDGAVSLLEAYGYITEELRTRWNEQVSEDLRYYPHVSGVPYDIILYAAD